MPPFNASPLLPTQPGLCPLHTHVSACLAPAAALERGRRPAAAVASQWLPLRVPVNHLPQSLPHPRHLLCTNAMLPALRGSRQVSGYHRMKGGARFAVSTQHGSPAWGNDSLAALECSGGFLHHASCLGGAEQRVAVGGSHHHRPPAAPADGQSRCQVHRTPAQCLRIGMGQNLSAHSTSESGATEVTQHRQTATRASLAHMHPPSMPAPAKFTSPPSHLASKKSLRCWRASSTQRRK